MKTNIHSKFLAHRANAKYRGIQFLLTFEEWLKIWTDSGHLHERGCRKGQYVMARFGDKGPYAADNVEIATVEKNHKITHSDEYILELKKRLTGNKYSTGHVDSEETSKRRSDAMIGNKNSLGWVHSVEARARMSAAAKIREANKRLRI